MGTRHLIAVVVNNSYKIAQYGQWDGYPSGQGLDILDFLRAVDLNRFKEQLKLVHFITEEEEEERAQFFKRIGTDNGWMDQDQANQYHRKYPLLTRDNSAKILDMVYNLKEPAFLDNVLDFAMDSLFCEWAYVIDLDKNVLEVYEGFNKEPIRRGRFISNIPDRQGYYCIKLSKTYPLSRLPDNDKFIKELDPPDEE